MRGATTARFCIATKTAKQDGAAKVVVFCLFGASSLFTPALLQKRSKKHTSSATEKKGVQKTKADQGKADKADVKPHEKAGLKAPLKVFVYADASAQMNGVDEACFLHAHPPPEVERLLSVLATADYESKIITRWIHDKPIPLFRTRVARTMPGGDVCAQCAFDGMRSATRRR